MQMVSSLNVVKQIQLGFRVRALGAPVEPRTFQRREEALRHRGIVRIPHRAPRGPHTHLHGLAGSAAVALLVLTTIRERDWAMLYLVVFGAGTVVGMMLITMAVALPFRYGAGQRAWLNRGLRVASGAISLGFGLFMVWRFGGVDGLFDRVPTWTPQ